MPSAIGYAQLAIGLGAAGDQERLAGIGRMQADLAVHAREKRAVLVGEDVAHLQGERCLRLRRPHPFHQAHAAIAGHRQAFMIAEAGNLRPRLLAGLQHGTAGGYVNFRAIYDKFYHG